MVMSDNDSIRSTEGRRLNGGSPRDISPPDLSDSSDVSKESLLLLPPIIECDMPRRGSRRRFLRQSIAVAAGATALGIVRPRETEAGILGWIAATVFAAGISWVVDKVLDSWVSSDADKLDLRKVSNPQPSSSKFHNRFTEPWIVGNHDFYVTDRYLASYGTTCGLRQFLRLTDLNGDEMTALQRECHWYQCALLPVGTRRPYSSYDRDALDMAEKTYNTQIAPESVKYVRTFVDDRQQEHPAFGVARGGKAQLLLV